MLIEATRPIRVLIPDGELRLDPGRPMDLPEAQALKLLVKAGGHVRRVEPITALNLDQLRPGVWVEWESPLLGHCHGHVAMSPEDGWFVVRGHSVTGNLALIHSGWDVRVIPGPPPTETSPPIPPRLELG